MAERIGVFGGTFDPVHLGHLILAEEARIALALDRVLFVPAAQPWRKQRPAISSPAHRLAMVRLAIAGNEDFQASTIEIDRGGPTYTADTLDELRTAAPLAAFWFVLGSDALQDLPNWKDPARILKQARLAVAPRPEVPVAVEDLQRELRNRLDLLPMPQIAMSSSELRRRLRNEMSVRYWLPPAVADYAREHALYAAVETSSVSRGS